MDQTNNAPKPRFKLPFQGTAIFETLQTVFYSFLITAFIYAVIAIPNQVDGASMEDNFHDGELILTNKFIQIINAIGLGDDISYVYDRGDVIIFQQPGKPDFIKRIIAKEGDTIKIEGGEVFVNGKKLEEKYLEDSEDFITELPNEYLSFLNEGEEKTVPEGKFFVMGDNRPHSQDSRYTTVGWVEEGQIKGRVFFRYWPIGQLGIIQRGEFNEIEP